MDKYVQHTHAFPENKDVSEKYRRIRANRGSDQVISTNNLKRLRRVDQESSIGHLTYCAARLLPALSRLTPLHPALSRLMPAYYAARLLCRLIFDLPINSLLTRYASVTAPAEEKARCRAVGSAPDLRSP